MINMKKLGILGGMGPLATTIFYEKIINNTLANTDQEHINTLISSNTSIPDRTDIILNKLDKNLIINSVKEDLKLFEKANVQKIAVPCNTFHYFYEDVARLTTIDIINMPEETIKKVYSTNKKNIVILGTKGTINGKVYNKYANKYNINIKELNDEDKNKLMKIIYNIKSTNSRVSPELNNIIKSLILKDIDYVLLACTELSCVVLDEDLKKYVIDSLEILAEESILQMGYNLKK